VQARGFATRPTWLISLALRGVLDAQPSARHRAPDVHAAGRDAGCAVIDARLKIVVVTGLLLILAGIAVTLTQSPITVAAVNTSQTVPLGGLQRGKNYCQSSETLPRETSAIRLRAYAFLGPRVSVEVVAHGHVIAHGQRGSGWTGGVVTIPVNSLSAARAGVTLCFTFFTNEDETIGPVGEPTTGALAARARDAPSPGRVRVEYLRLSRSSWWSLMPEVARRMGLGHAPSGTWTVFLVLALMGGLIAVCARVVLGELR